MPFYNNDFQVKNPNGYDVLTSKLNEINFIELKTINSNYVARQTAVRIVLDSNNERIAKYLKKLHEHNKLDDWVHNALFIMSYYGVVFPVVERINENFDGHKLWNINFANPRLFNVVAMLNVSNIGASYYKSYISGTSIVWEYIQVSKDKIIKQPTKQTYLTIMSGQVPVPTDEQATIEPNGYGFVPVWRILNRPDRTIWRNTYDEYADDWPVRHIPSLVNHFFRQLWKEAIYNKTRVFGNFSLAERNKFAKQGNAAEQSLMRSDYMIQTNIPQGGQSLITQPANPVFESYTNSIREQIDLYKDGCLLSSPNDTNAQKTESEVLYDKSRDAETCEFKRKLLTTTLYEIIDEILHYEQISEKGQEKREYTIEIQANLITNEIQLTDLVIQQVNAKLISQAEAIAKLRNIKPNDANEIAEQINKEALTQIEAFNQVAQQGVEPNEQQTPPNTNEQADETEPDTSFVRFFPKNELTQKGK